MPHLRPYGVPETCYPKPNAPGCIVVGSCYGSSCGVPRSPSVRQWFRCSAYLGNAFFLNYLTCLHRASGRCGSEFQKRDGPRLIDAGLLLLSGTYNREYMTADDQPLPRQQQPTKPSNFGAYGSVGLSVIGNDASRVCRARLV